MNLLKPVLVFAPDFDLVLVLETNHCIHLNLASVYDHMAHKHSQVKGDW